MALFNSKDKKKSEDAVAEVQAPKAADAKVAPATVATPKVTTAVLRAPHITEKATDLAEDNVYVFTVEPTANKRQVKDAIKALYKVDAKDVRMVTLPRKSVRHPRRGTYGTTNIVKKAYVQLKKGDTISLM